MKSMGEVLEDDRLIIVRASVVVTGGMRKVWNRFMAGQKELRSSEK